MLLALMGGESLPSEFVGREGETTLENLADLLRSCLGGNAGCLDVVFFLCVPRFPCCRHPLLFCVYFCHVSSPLVLMSHLIECRHGPNHATNLPTKGCSSKDKRRNSCSSSAKATGRKGGRRLEENKSTINQHQHIMRMI